MHRKLLQLLRDNATKAGALKVENAADSATIYLYDVIDSYFGIGAADFNKELAGLKGKQVHLRINSPGGDVFDARAMATAITNHGNVTAHIDGLAASAATYVALAANRVEMADGSFFMIHNAWTMAYGNKNDFAELINLLDKIDQTIISDYANKTGKPTDEIAALMTAETWFTAQEAMDSGFVDSVTESAKVDNRWNLSAYANAPKIEQKSEEELLNTYREAAERRMRLLPI